MRIGTREWDATELGDDTGRAYAVQADNDPTVVFVTYNEGLRWHHEAHNVRENLTDADLEEMAEAVMAEMGDTHRVTAWRAQDSDDPEEEAVEFSIEIPAKGELTDDVVADLAWPFIATCINVTDPGTFGAPYIFGPYTEEG